MKASEVDKILKRLGIKVHDGNLVMLYDERCFNDAKYAQIMQELEIEIL